MSNSRWRLIYHEDWGRDQGAFWGPYQRFQLDHVPLLRQAYQQMGLLSRTLWVSSNRDCSRARNNRLHTLHLNTIPWHWYAIPWDRFWNTTGKCSRERLCQRCSENIVNYLFAGYPTERIMAFTDQENSPAQIVLEKNWFQQEGRLRCSMFRDGQWRDILIYGILRPEVELGRKKK